jgi:hypothetical protein
MKPQKVLNNFDPGSQDLPGVRFAINGPECQLNSTDLLNVFKKNLEMLRDNYLQQTEAEFYFEVSKTQHHLNRVDPLTVDWVSREALLSEYETNHRPQHLISLAANSNSSIKC